MLPFDTWFKFNKDKVPTGTLSFANETNNTIVLSEVNESNETSVYATIQMNDFIQGDTPGGYLSQDFVDGLEYFWETSDGVTGLLYRINKVSGTVTAITSVAHPTGAFVINMFIYNKIMYMVEYNGSLGRSFISKFDFSGGSDTVTNWLTIDGLVPFFQRNNNDWYYFTNNQIRVLPIPTNLAQTWIPDPSSGTLVNDNLPKAKILFILVI